MNARDVLEHASKRSPALQVDTRSKQSRVESSRRSEVFKLQEGPQDCRRDFIQANG